MLVYISGGSKNGERARGLHVEVKTSQWNIAQKVTSRWAKSNGFRDFRLSNHDFWHYDEANVQATLNPADWIKARSVEEITREMQRHASTIYDRAMAGRKPGAALANYMRTLNELDEARELA